MKLYKFPQKSDMANEAIARRCINVAFEGNENKDFFLAIVNEDGTLGVYGSMSIPESYLLLDGAKAILQEKHKW